MTVVRRRRLVTRRRRLPLFRWRRRRMINSIIVRATALVSFTPSSSASNLQIAPSITTFPELISFYNLFETYQFLSVSVTCIPQANVAQQDIPTLTYASAPYHKPLTSVNAVTLNDIMTLDRSRQYQGVRRSFRRFVPAVSMDVRSGSTSVPAVQRYRPIITPLQGFAGDSIPHYCALYVFQVPLNAITYTITLRAICKFRDQKTTSLT